MSNDTSTEEIEIAKKEITPHSERSPGRPKGRKDLLPRKPRQKLDVRKRRAFLRELRKHGSISYAAASVNLSRATIYRAMTKSEEFARMVDDNKALAFGALEEYAYKRVMDGEKTIKRDGEGNIIETIEKPASAALVSRLLDATETYSKKQAEETHLHVHTEGMGGAVSKLIQALGIQVDQSDFEKIKDIDGEIIEGEITTQKKTPD